MITDEGEVIPENTIAPEIAKTHGLETFILSIDNILSIDHIICYGMGDMVGARRDWSYLQDIVDAYVLLAEKGEKGSTYVIGSGKSYSIGEFIEKVKMMLSISPPVYVYIYLGDCCFGR